MNVLCSEVDAESKNVMASRPVARWCVGGGGGGGGCKACYKWTQPVV